MGILNLHANVYAQPSDMVPGPLVTLRGEQRPTLQSAAGGPPRFLATLPITFEAIQQQLLETTHSDCEPDGFFLVTGKTPAGFWRLNGHMHEYQPEGDDTPRMHRIELHGECPVEVFDQVLNAFGWPQQKLVFELVQEGVSLDEATLRDYAAAEASPS